MATEELIGLSDDGPKTCCLIAAARHAQKFKSLVLLDNAVEAIKFECLALQPLVKAMTKANPLIIKGLTTRAVAKWIFCTNKIEHAGLETEGDTEQLILGNRIASNSAQDTEVLQTLSVLKQNYAPCDPNNITSKVFDSLKIALWHKVMFTGLLAEPGKFRTSGVFVRDNMVVHKYPHHSMVNRSIKLLCQLVWCLAKKIDEGNPKDDYKHIGRIIALASFAQFHFVDIHPFIDGNGRMCRFLSKHILDSIFPLPFPMFEDRNTYIASLTTGRAQQPGQEHIPLAKLLASSAFACFSTFVTTFIESPIYFEVCASSLEDLQEELVSNPNFLCDENDLQMLYEKFTAMKDFESISVNLQKSFYAGVNITKLADGSTFE